MQFAKLAIAVSLLSSAALSFPLSAAAQVPPVQTQPTSGPEEDVVGSLSSNDTVIAIPSFATDADLPTATSAGSSAAVGRAMAQIITDDLRNNGLFKPVGPGSLPAVAFGEVAAPQFGKWRSLSSEMLLQGYVKAGPGGQLSVGCYIYDVQLGTELARQGYVVGPADWRRAAHRCADMAFTRLTGETPFFDSRIAYIAETGPKGNRRKQLAIMDSDGANHRFLTSGAATALTPRYSPDYKSILYLSYLNGNPRIYIYDLASGKQRLVTQSTSPTFAPRWSPDGRSILYSMAVNGNTDIYLIPATGGTPRRLTDNPGIDVGGSFSPDGRSITFESDRSGSQQCYVMNADGTNQQRISFAAGRCATPEWSPRGDQIAFTSITGNFRIGVMTPAGQNMRLLTDSWQDEAPTWSPNGRIIQFFRTAKGTGKASIWQVDLTGANERMLKTPVDGSDPAWGPVLP